MKNKTKHRVTTPELQHAVEEKLVTRTGDTDTIFEITQRISNQLSKQKRIDCYDWCVTMHTDPDKSISDIEGDHENLMLSLAYKNKTVLLKGYVIDGEVNTDTVDFLKRSPGSFFYAERCA